MGEEEFDMSLFDSEDIELNLDSIGQSQESDSDQEEEITNNTSEEEGDDLISDTVTSEDTDEPNGDDDSSAEDANNTETPTMYSSFANLLHEEGLLSSLESSDEIKSVADIKSLVEKEIETRINSQFTEEQLSDLEAIQNGVSKQDLANYYDTNNKLDSITGEVIENNIELRKQLIYQDYINQGLSENKALKLLDRSIKLESDIEDAAEALQSIKSFEAQRIEATKEQAKINKAQEEAQYKAQQDKIKSSIYDTDEIIKGQPLTQNIKDKIYNSMTTVVNTLEDGSVENELMKNRREDPIGFDSKLYYLYEMTKGFSDFSILTKKATSRASADLEQALRTTSFIQDSGLPAYLQDRDSYDSGLGNELVLD